MKKFWHEKQLIFLYLIGILTTGLFLFLHFYKLGIIPNGIHVDEISSAYDAFCLSVYGVERHLRPYPVYFLNHGDGQSALATYLVFLLDKLAGHASVLTVRLIPAIFSVVAGIFGVLYTREKWKSLKATTAFMILYSILPIYISMQRWLLDSQLLMPLSMVICFMAWKAYQNKSILFYLLTGIICSVAMYTYVLSFIIVPVFLLFMLAFAIRSKKIDVKCALALSVPYIVLSIPILTVQIINLLDLEEMIILGFDFTKLGAFRSGDLSPWPLWLGLARSFKSAFVGDYTNFNAISRYGTLYYVSIPFVVIGFATFIKEAVRSWKTREVDASIPILAWTTGSLVVMAMLNTEAQPTTSRINYIYFMLLIFLVQGLISVWELLDRKKVLQYSFLGIISAVYLASFISYGTYYFKVYPTAQLLDFYPVYEDVAAYYASEEGERSSQNPLCLWNGVAWKDYYYYSFKLNPAEQPAYEENGLQFIGGRLTGPYPDEIRLDANYIVVYSDISSPEILTSCGFEQKDFDQCRLFESPLLCYQKKMLDEGLQVDRMIWADGEISISGWCIDMEANSVYDRIICEVDGEKEYVASEIERADVVEAHGNSNYLNSGFDIRLPMDTFRTGSTIVLYGVRQDGTKKELLAYSH